MKIKIATGTPIEGTRLEVDGPVVKLWNKAPKGNTRVLLLAYCLHPGESVRRVIEADGGELYEVQQ